MDQLSAFSLCDPVFDQAVRNIADAGFRHMALYFAPGRLPCELETMSDADARSIRDKLASHNIKAIAAGGGSNVLTQEGLDLLLKKLDGAAKLGVSVLDTGSLSTKDKSAEVVERETALFCRSMAKAGDAAAQRGITICLETHGGLTGTVPSSLDLMKRLAHPNVKIGYDPANILYYEGASPVERLTELVPYIGHIHAKDHAGGKGSPNFPTVGKGETPYPAIFKTLRERGYKGYVSLERAPGDTPEERAKVLKDAFTFLRGFLE